MKKIKVLIVAMFVLTLAIAFTTKVYAEEVGGFVPNQEYVFEEEDGDIYLILNEDGTAKVNGTHDDGTILEFTCEYTTCCENMHLTLNALGNSLYLEMDEEGTITGVDYLHEDIIEEEEYITSESGNFFEEEIQPILIEMLSGISIGSIISFIVWIVFKRRTKETIISSDKVYDLVIKLLDRLQELEKIVEQSKIINNGLESNTIANQSLIAEILAIKSAIKMVVCNDPNMVANGLATRIEKELEGNGESNEK